MSLGESVASFRPEASDLGASAKRCPVCLERYPLDFRVCPHDAAELEVAPDAGDPLLGCVLGDSYEILRVIGEGGMGRVYEARHRRLTSKRFAIKVLHAELSRQPEVVSRFQREAEATSALQHANVVAVLDVNSAPDGRPFIVVELLEGVQLGEYLERCGVLSVGEAVQICRQICAALIAAHEHDIVHRDIKPENVFLVGPEPRRVVKVLDFGISKIGSGAATLTKTGMVMGTPAYMPPEQARGLRVDHRADIYAVGAILYQAVTGRRPFDGPDLMATLASVLSQEPPRPCALNSSLPPVLELTIQRAMAKDPAERQPTMRELDAELAVFDLSGLRRDPANDVAAAVRPSAAPGVRDMSRSARRARLQIVLLTLGAASWMLAGLIDVATTSLRWVRGEPRSSATELFLICAGSIALAIAPATTWIRHIGQRVWPSTPRSVELVARMRRVLAASFVGYASTALSIRVFEALHGDPARLSWPGWALAAIAAALLAAAISDSFERIRRARRRKISAG